MDAWTCTHCGARNSIEARQCWRCGAGADGSAPKADAPVDHRADVPSQRRMECLRCTGTRMEFSGRGGFHEGTQQAMPFPLGELGELFVHREVFDLYVCPSCGKVELFLASTPH